MSRYAALAAGVSIALVACSPATEPASPGASGSPRSSSPAATAADQFFPDVVAAELTPGESGFSIAVTISSPYDSPEQYADGWRVLTPDGVVLAEHDLAHDHANEQPFTRTRGPFEIPDDLDQVVVEGRDLVNGYGGGAVTIDVPGG